MFVDIKSNKWQIAVSSIISVIYFYYTNNIQNSILLVLILSILLRGINIDVYIDSYLNNTSVK